MTKDLIYEDNIGNRLIRDVDNRLIIVNKNNELVSIYEVNRFMSRYPVRLAMKRYFGDIPKIKILNSKQTHNIKKKVIGGTY